MWLVDGRTVDEGQLAARMAWLSPGEMARYRRFVRRERQRQFLIGRILLRCALARLLGVRPRSLSLTERPGQAPLLQWDGAAPGFSIAHSGPWVACAVSARAPLGLDIERLDAGRDVLALSEQALDDAGAKQVALLQDDERTAAFYGLWSEKEARYKLASTTAAGAAEASLIRLPHAELAIALCAGVSQEEMSARLTCGWPGAESPRAG